MSKIRVVVAEDSMTVRKHLCEVLATDKDIEVVGEARDGKEAIRLCQEKHPDVITMDMMMPSMSGLAATEYIMAHCPTPILVVSASTNRGELFKTYEALAAGAVDVLEKPKGDESDNDWERHFLSTVKLVSRIHVITHIRARLPSTASATAHSPAHPCPGPAVRQKVVAIGASTGGPAAIVHILRGLPAKLATPILLVLHINEPFGTAFADWLDGQTRHSVAFAKDGEPITSLSARVVMAPPDFHLAIERGHLRLRRDPPRHSCRPSVDVLFESVARECGPEAVACLLTGMGRDGAEGLLKIRQAGGFTIAQDEASCVVYGMPREAVQLKAAMRVLPLDDIAAVLSLG